MARTLPDYSTKYKLSNTFSGFDLNELASRQGANSMLHRSGKVIWYDNFEQTQEHWAALSAGTDAEVTLITNRAHFGSQSCLLQGGSSAGGWAEITKAIDIPPTGKLGFEFSFHYNAYLSHLLAYMLVYDGTTNYEAILKFDITNTKIQYNDKNDAYQDLATSIPFYRTYRNFHNVKYIIDSSNSTYDSLTFLQTTYDMTAYDLRNVGASTVKSLVFSLVAYSTTGDNGKAWIDNVIITQEDY